ncbi:PAS and ANTAR domain-containing protein [Nocardioides sp.]|uniref:PAS and ANTAR domain-containing protein n=1 Tax=Nocardioides sp. TaxID=35761 RepID=UPI002D15CD56|nr:PAS and ANTAR domain-containing protein [Nocardioides sp.]HXH79718.1 PAS and ANTAR domain-containing protein [Nocardioides sp.]
MGELNFDGRPNNTPVGYFSYFVEDDVWSWSDGMYELHGYEPRAMPATTDLMLKHKHPDDALRAYEVLEAVTSDGLPFSCYHRIISTDDQVRYVLSVGRGVLGPHGRVESVTGYFVDLTGVRERQVPQDGETALVRAAEARSTVDQAKGIVMVALGCDDVAAFTMLREHADRSDLKVGELAQMLVEEVAARPLAEGQSQRTRLDELLGRILS